jgi:hypothetical protein
VTSSANGLSPIAENPPIGPAHDAQIRAPCRRGPPKPLVDEFALALKFAGGRLGLLEGGLVKRKVERCQP